MARGKHRTNNLINRDPKPPHVGNAVNVGNVSDDDNSNSNSNLRNILKPPYMNMARTTQAMFHDIMIQSPSVVPSLVPRPFHPPSIPNEAPIPWAA
jgi:hypothetical protein